MRWPRWPGRFEWKILGIVLLGAAVSAGTVAYALSYALGGFLASSRYEDRTLELFKKAEDLYRSYSNERKDEFRRRALALARHWPTDVASLAGTEGLLRARLFEGDLVKGEWRAPPEEARRLHEAPAISVDRVPPLGQAAGPAAKLELTFGIPEETWRHFRELAYVLDRERQRGQVFEAFVAAFIRQYVALVIALLIVVPLGGLYFARRATRRLARLTEAARQVGAGDLSVRLQPTGRDELDDVARAFDGMVEELSDARSRLEYLQKVSAWQEVARRLAHEIKNPLTPIQLAMQELVTKYQGDDPVYQRVLATAAEISKEEITALRRLVDDFSAFAKLPKVEPQPQDLGTLLADFARRHPEFSSTLEVEPPEAPVSAACDRILFGRVLANLVENAVQAAEGAGVTAPRVRLSIASHTRPTASLSMLGTPRLSREMAALPDPRSGRRRIAILVDDNGPGVPPDIRARIFDPYVTTKPQGTGLGLAIVRKILLDHGGDISVSASPSPLGGARFVVELPQIS